MILNILSSIKLNSSLIIIVIFFTSQVKSQSIDKVKITGTWTLVSHSTTTKDKAMQLKFQEYSNRTYTFNEDGTFILKFYGKASEMAMLGKWVLDPQSKKLNFSKIKIQIASPPPFTNQDKSIQFIEFTDSTFSIKESFESDLKPGLSIYKKAL